MNELTTLFQKYIEEPGTVILLQDKTRKTVGTLYLDKITPENLGISFTNNDEKYYLYYQGLAVFFTYWRKITP